MAQMIFVSLPVRDLERSKAFYAVEARPALQQALADQLQTIAANQPQFQPA